MKVVFDRKVYIAGQGGGDFARGETYDLPEAIAQRCIRNGDAHSGDRSLPKLVAHHPDVVLLNAAKDLPLPGAKPKEDTDAEPSEPVAPPAESPRQDDSPVGPAVEGPATCDICGKKFSAGAAALEGHRLQKHKVK